MRTGETTATTHWPEIRDQLSGQCTQVLIFVKYNHLGQSTTEASFKGACAKVSHDVLTGTPNLNKQNAHKDHKND